MHPCVLTRWRRDKQGCYRLVCVCVCVRERKKWKLKRELKSELNNVISNLTIGITVLITALIHPSIFLLCTFLVGCSCSSLEVIFFHVRHYTHACASAHTCTNTAVAVYNKLFLVKFWMLGCFDDWARLYFRVCVYVCLSLCVCVSVCKWEMAIIVRTWVWVPEEVNLIFSLKGATLELQIKHTHWLQQCTLLPMVQRFWSS